MEISVLKTEKNIQQALETASAGVSADDVINNLVAYIGETLSSDRCYIFERTTDNISNTFEWTANGAEPQIKNRQNYTQNELDEWCLYYQTYQKVLISDIEDIIEIMPCTYKKLKSQHITSIVAVPLTDNGKVIGFYGVDNPPLQSMPQITEVLEKLSFFIISGLRSKKLEAYDGNRLLDAMHTIGVFIITEKEHKILYYNDKIKQVTPGIKIGRICNDVWKGSCANCPLLYIKDKKSHTCVNCDTPVGMSVDITATKYLWQNKIPSYIVQVTPHADSADEHEMRKRGMYIDVMNDMFFKSVLVDLETGCYESFHMASHSSDFAEYGVYDELVQSQLEIIDENYRDDILKNCSFQALKDHFQKGNCKYECIYKTTRTDGFTWLRCIASICSDIYCEKKYMIVMIENVTEEKEREMNAERALKNALYQAKAASIAKTTFLSNMSHDIRTPMNAILGFASIAASHINDTKCVEDSIRKIMTSGEHLQGIINDILDMSRIEAGKVTVNLNIMSVSKLIQDSLHIVQTQVQKKQQELFVDIMNINNDTVWMDITKMRQILVNILGNAVKFTDVGGQITIKVIQQASRKKDHAVYSFHIKDNGIGMSRDFIHKIFDAFEQEHMTASGNTMGTGLGMSISKNLVEMMGGTIRVESEEEQGCEVIVDIEFKLEDNKQTKNNNSLFVSEMSGELLLNTPQKAAESIAFNGENILLVEDNELNTEIALFLLKDIGFQVQTADNGKAALDILSSCPENTFRYILMDIQMPVMNGFETAKRIRELDRADTKKIPIIAVTANAFNEDAEACYKAGMNGHLAKPFVREDLINILNKVNK